MIHRLTCIFLSTFYFLLSAEGPPLKRARIEEEGKYSQNKEGTYSQSISTTCEIILIDHFFRATVDAFIEKTKDHDAYVHLTLHYFPLFFFIKTNLFDYAR